MIGGMRKKKKLFDMGGVPDDVMTPGGGLGGGVPSMEEEQKPGFFGEGGIGRGIIGVLGDTLSQSAGGQGTFIPNLYRQKQMDLRQRNAEQARAADMQDWQTKQDYTRANPKPQSPTALQKDYEWLKQNQPGLAEQYLQNKVTAPPVVISNPDGTKTIMPAGMIPRGNRPTKPVGKLRPVQATTQNTPAPSLGPNGMPQMLSRQQYQAVVNSLGKAKTDEWIAKNNVQVGAQ